MKPTKIPPAVVERAARAAWAAWWQGGWEWPPLDRIDARGWRVAIRAALRAAAEKPKEKARKGRP